MKTRLMRLTLLAMVVSLGLTGTTQAAPAGKKLPTADEFCQQIRYGDNSDQIIQHLNDGMDANAKDKQGMPALAIGLLNIGPDSPNYPQVRKMVDALLKHGADVNAPLPDKTTVLFMSVESGDLELTKAFIAKKADVNAKAMRGRTPLMAAAGGGSLEMVQLLIEKGADPNAKMENGQNAWAVAHAFVSGPQTVVAAYLAKRTNRQDIEALLRKDSWTEVAIRNYFEKLDAKLAGATP